MSTASGHATNSLGGRIRPAKAVSAMVLLLAMIAMVAILVAGWNPWLKALVAMLALAYSVREILCLLRPPWHTIRIVDRELTVQNKHDQSVRIELRSAPFLSPLYIGIRGRIKGSGRPVRLGLFRGQLEDQDFRRLGVGLRELSGSVYST